MRFSLDRGPHGFGSGNEFGIGAWARPLASALRWSARSGELNGGNAMLDPEPNTPILVLAESPHYASIETAAPSQHRSRTSHQAGRAPSLPGTISWPQGDPCPAGPKAVAVQQACGASSRSWGGVPRKSEKDPSGGPPLCPPGQPPQ